MRRRRGSCGQGFEPRLLPVERRRAESSGPPAELPVVAQIEMGVRDMTPREVQTQNRMDLAMCITMTT